MIGDQFNDLFDKGQKLTQERQASIQDFQSDLTKLEKNYLKLFENCLADYQKGLKGLFGKAKPT